MIGLPEDELLSVSCGGRFEVVPERCAVLERRQVALLQRVRGEMKHAYDEHVAYEARLRRMCEQHGAMVQYVPKRRGMLSVYTEKELKRWFESRSASHPTVTHPTVVLPYI